MSWRGFGAISPNSQKLGPLQTRGKDFDDEDSNMNSTIETPSMLVNSVSQRRSTTNPEAARGVDEGKHQATSQVAEAFESMRGAAIESDEDFAMNQKTRQGRLMAKLREERESGVKIRLPSAKEKFKQPAPKPKPVIPKLTQNGGNMPSGLVLGSMQSELGLPAGWKPPPEDEKAKDYNIPEAKEHTGLVLPSMTTEEGLPLGWKRENPKKAHPMDTSNAVGELMRGG